MGHILDEWLERVVDMAECCSITGGYGIALLVLCLVLGASLGLACCVGAAVSWRKGSLMKRKDVFKSLYYAVPGAMLLVADAIAAFFPLDLMVGVGAFSVEFFIEVVLLLIFAVNFTLNYKEGSSAPVI